MRDVLIREMSHKRDVDRDLRHKVTRRKAMKTEVEIRFMLPEAEEYMKVSEARRGQDGLLKGVWVWQYLDSKLASLRL